jgi:3-deoxy-D-manno-octulosonic-acid transferase
MTAGLAGWRLLTRVLSPVAPLLLKQRAARGKEDWTRLNERLGVAGLPRPPGRLVWIHGASVGESLSALPLFRKQEISTCW